MGRFGYSKTSVRMCYIVSKTELIKLSKELHTEFIDEFIPIPNRKDECLTHSNKSSILYWETITGNMKGICCSICGKVLEWEKSNCGIMVEKKSER
jgi:hypothetical protein